MNRYTRDDARERIIRWHIKHYPRLETRDLVKLAYQDVFGNRHFQSGKEDALEKIRDEIKSQTPAGLPNILIEPVSSEPATGWVRVSLTGWKRRVGSFDVLAGVFTASAAVTPRDPAGFPTRLQWMEAFLSREQIAVPGESLDTWRKTMESHGYPPISHSRTYSFVYQPTYRVVYFPLLARFLPLRRTALNSQSEKPNAPYG